jgi:hypothetical protein
MQINQFLDNHQPEAGPSYIGYLVTASPLEAIKHVGQILGIDTNARILNLKLDGTRHFARAAADAHMSGRRVI